ncbi:transcriptional regulator with XRE-family HTH domain [Rubricella aquisinus]|uniref:Transcriptional regulator with XRE-family HTH domain n=1 Tax=Rubricella aquisinus TaxID=2028108 RepID=A0A840WM65_9RHOB|nr:helix-turn-helix transcriptional regulator [Rubricella aquisinus]MBB5516178.1 transcriptional regulator with XRE-family HTH domain [Rubricella aquisinus]
MSTFGETLKSWRHHRHLSQLDLAGVAEVSARHISFLESGRARPSRGMILRLAQRMNLPHRARNDMLLSAGYAPAAAPLRAEDALAPVRDAIRWTMERHMPYPAYAIDRHWQIIEMNPAAAHLLGAVGIGLGDGLVTHLIENAALRDALDNLDEVLRHSLARLRTEAAHFGADPRFDAWIARIAEEVTPSDDPLPPIVPSIYRLGDMRLSLFATIGQFGTAEDVALSEVKLELMYPSDEATARQLHALFGTAAEG